MRQNIKRNAVNKLAKSKIKNLYKEIAEAVKEQDKQKAGDKLSLYYKSLDKAVKRNIVKKNYAARKKAQAAGFIKKEEAQKAS